MKQIKPGQLCTIRGAQYNKRKKILEFNLHTYRCKQSEQYRCLECKNKNKHKKHSSGCVLYDNGTFCSFLICVLRFRENYPILVK